MRSVLPHLIGNFFLRRPTFTVFFVTGRCNLNCKMCFYTRHRQAENELALEEIQRLAAAMPAQWFLMFTGGEPFLRPDLVEIAAAFYERGAVNMHFSTNGTLTEKTLRDVRTIATRAKQSRILVVASIDGPPEIHDAIRGMTGAFNKTIATLQGLAEMKHALPNLGVGVNFTFSAYNQNHWRETIDFVRHKLTVDAINIGLTRGQTSDPAAKDFDVNLYWQAHRYLAQANRRRYFRGLTRFMASFKDVAQAENIYKIARGITPPYYRCMAGRVFNVIAENGDVYPCEMLPTKLGNLRDFDMSLPRLLAAPAAHAVRRQIDRRQCLCTYECAMTASLASHWAVFPQLLDFLRHYRRKMRDYYET